MAQRPFEEIVAEFGDVVWRVCRALLGPADAEDAWSETFLAALRRYPELPPGSNVKGWLVTIGHNKSIGLLRASSRRAVPAADVPERTDGPLPDPIGELRPDGGLRRAVEQL